MAALEGEVEAKLSACFYKSDGRPFWCLLDIIPIKNELDEVNYIIGSDRSSLRHARPPINDP